MNRTIMGRAAPAQLSDLLASVFLAEFLRPSSRLFLHAPWLENVPLLDNRLNAYRTLLPDLAFRVITLADVLVELHQRGTGLDLAVADAERSVAMLDRLRTLLARSPGSGRVQLLHTEGVPGQGLLGDDFYLEGSLVWAQAGVAPGQAPVVMHTAPQDIAEARSRWTAFWEERADDAQPLP